MVSPISWFVFCFVLFGSFYLLAFDCFFSLAFCRFCSRFVDSHCRANAPKGTPSGKTNARTYTALKKLASITWTIHTHTHSSVSYYLEAQRFSHGRSIGGVSHTHGHTSSFFAILNCFFALIQMTPTRESWKLLLAIPKTASYLLCSFSPI